MLKKVYYLVVCVALFAGCHKDDDDDKLVIGEDYVEKGVSGFSFDMVYVEGGTFRMGATEEQGEDYDSDEKPVHSVTL